MRVRQHVNPLMPFFEEFRGRRPRLRDGVAVEIEVGCAEAQFLFERAARDPERIYLGFEIRDKLVREVNAEAEARGAPVQGIFCNANHHLRQLLPAGRVARAYLNFPDPWFKKKHHDRRMVDEGLVADIAEVLEPGGALFVQTDVFAIALDALYAAELVSDRLVNRAGSWRFWRGGNPYGARSWREQNAEAEGLPIWRLLFEKRGPQLVR
jgi:tRNA (guanine-N7-)-methyltransferase